MAKLPYIPLYIGDWEQDTNCLSLKAKGALLKLTFKLFRGDPEFGKGLLTISFRTMSILFKTSLENTHKIWQELADNKLLDYEKTANGDLLIKSRRMLKERKISEIRSETGSLGGRKAKEKQTPKQNKSKQEAKGKQNTEYDIVIKNEIVNSKKSAEIVFPFEGEVFRAVWDTWKQYRAQIKKPYRSKISEQAALKMLAAYDEVTATQMIQKSIENSWQGIFELDEKKHGYISKQTASGFIGESIGISKEQTIDRLNSYTN